MKHKVSNHSGYYISLAAILFFGFLAIQKSPTRDLQMIFFFLITFFYIVLGIMHHLLNHKFSAKIMIEYVLIGCLGISIIFFILKGGLGI